MIKVLRTLSWSTYLCNSWMWCIGMFYPVLLFRDFGIVSWFIFTIPNIIGASLVPWIIRSAKSSEDFTRQHSFACRFFSFATILFHIYFISWVSLSFGGQIFFPIIFITALIFISVLSTARQKNLLFTSLMTFLVSLILLLLIFAFTRGTEPISREAAGGIPEALGLVPVFLIGFFFCPYLDLTFHRVIKELPEAKVKWVYSIGFFVLFLGFLILGIKYFPFADHLLFGTSGTHKTGVLLCISLYFLLQSTFTSAIHLNELLRQKTSLAVWFLFLCAFFSVFLYSAIANGEVYVLGSSMHLREAFYRGFLSIYGLLVPVYIWVFVVLKRIHWQAWSAGILCALPFYVVGFYGDIHLIPFVLPLGVLVALLIPVLILHLNPGISRRP